MDSYHHTNINIHPATLPTTPVGSKYMSPLNTSSSPTPATSLPSPPHSPPASTTRRVAFHAEGMEALKTTRRQSSISYVSSRVDVYSRHAPTTPVAVADSWMRADSGHAERNSFEVGGRPTRTSRSMKRQTIAGLEGLRGSNEVSEAHAIMSAEGGSKAPLTLADKHADLLHTIAAAESRRLELQGQLATVEEELGELKRKWERIINREPPHPVLPTSNVHTSASVVVDGLKEGVRLLAAGLSDLSDITSSIPEPAPATNVEERTGVSMRHTQRESNSSISTSTRSWNERLSTGSVSSGLGGDTSFGIGGKATEDSELCSRRKGQNDEVDRERQAKVFRRRSRDASHPPPAFTRHATSYDSKSTSVDLGSTPDFAHGMFIPVMDAPVAAMDMSIPGICAHDAGGPGTPGRPGKNALRRDHSPTATLPPPSSMPGVGSFSMVGEAWGNVGRKLGGDVFSKGQKRASVLLADVSQSIASALSPGPVATTPAPAPSTSTPPTSTPPTSALSASSLPTPSSGTNSLRSPSPSAISLRIPISNTSSPLTRPISLRAPASATLPRTKSWLEDDDGENTVHAGNVMMPSVLTSTSSPSPINIETSTSFDDDDNWNW